MLQLQKSLKAYVKVNKESLFHKHSCEEAVSELNAIRKTLNEVQGQHQGTADAYNREMKSLQTFFADKEAKLQHTIASQKDFIAHCEVKIQHTIDMKDAVVALHQGEHAKVVEEKDAKIAMLEAQLSKLLAQSQTIKPTILQRYPR